MDGRMTIRPALSCRFGQRRSAASRRKLRG